MKKFKLLTIAVLATIAVCSAFVFAACDSEIKVHEHVFEEIAEAQYLKKAATCTEQAEYYKSCECGEKSTETFFSGRTLDHDFKWYPVIDDVEICTGHKFVSLCSVCNEQARGGEGVAYKFEKAHSDKWSLAAGSAPTVNETGLLKGVCSDCQKDAEYVLPALNITDYEYTKIESTCTTEGSETYTIEVDGQKFEFSNKLPVRHMIGGKAIVNDGTVKAYYDYPDVERYGDEPVSCAVGGTRCFYTCDICKKHFDVYVRSEHTKPADQSQITVKYDSCEDIRLVYYDCPNCDDDVTELKESLPALGHKFDYKLEIEDAEAKTWKITGVCTNEINGVVCGEHDDVSGIADSAVAVKEEATCTKGAIRSYLYKDVECTFTEAETIGHRYVDEESNVDTRLKSPDSGIVYKAEELPNLKIFANHKNYVCSELGNEAPFRCADCDEHCTALVKTEHTKGAVEHHDATCTTPETTDFVCTVCNEKVHIDGVPALGHDCRITVTAEPTLETAGAATITCSRCDFSTSIELPALNKTDYKYQSVEKQTCVKRGVEKYTYIYTGDLANEKGLPELVYTIVTETTSSHVNSDSPETIIVVIDGKRCRGYICANCNKFVIVETL